MKKVLLITVIATIGFIVWKNYKPFNTKIIYSSIKGIDISNRFDGDLNWSSLGEFKGFVILRALGCTYSGSSFVDKNFKKNWESLEKYDKSIPKGAYIRFATKTTAQEQFEMYKNLVPSEKGNLPPIIDVEENVNFDEVSKWIELVKEHYKVEPILYDNYSRYHSRKYQIPVTKVWLHVNAGLSVEPILKEISPIIWQYKQNTFIPGFGEKHTDLNQFLGDTVAFRNLLMK